MPSFVKKQNVMSAGVPHFLLVTYYKKHNFPPKKDPVAPVPHSHCHSKHFSVSRNLLMEKHKIGSYYDICEPR